MSQVRFCRRLPCSPPPPHGTSLCFPRASSGWEDTVSPHSCCVGLRLVSTQLWWRHCWVEVAETLPFPTPGVPSTAGEVQVEPRLLWCVSCDTEQGSAWLPAAWTHAVIHALRSGHCPCLQPCLASGAALALCCRWPRLLWEELLTAHGTVQGWGSCTSSPWFVLLYKPLSCHGALPGDIPSRHVPYPGSTSAGFVLQIHQKFSRPCLCLSYLCGLNFNFFGVSSESCMFFTRLWRQFKQILWRYLGSVPDIILQCLIQIVFFTLLVELLAGELINFNRMLQGEFGKSNYLEGTQKC